MPFSPEAIKKIDSVLIEAKQRKKERSLRYKLSSLLEKIFP